jgi:hypothetical protein
VPPIRLFATWRITIGFSALCCFSICSAFTTEAYMPDSARWTSGLTRSGSVSPAISDDDPRFWLFNIQRFTKTIETSFPMTILTGGELEILMGLRMSWGRLYSNEITRLRNEDDSKHAADCGVDLTDGLANRNEEGVIKVLHEVPTDGDLVRGLVWAEASGR